MTYIPNMPQILDRCNIIPIPLWVSAGYAMYSLIDMGLLPNDADDNVLGNLAYAYERECRRRERVTQWKPIQEKPMVARKMHFEKCVNWMIERLGGQGFLVYIHPGKGKVATDKARRIADIVSYETGNPGVMDQHVREAQRRIRERQAA